jgi:peptidoglycan/xylan/chitin deacetylase (PgdA/CDA1 family)
MFLTIVSEQGHTPTSSRAFSPTVRHNLDDFFAALAKRLDDERLVPLARQRLDRLIIENAIDSPDRVGSIQRCRVRVGEPCQQFIIEPGVDRLVVELWRGEDRLNRVILPACGRFLPAGVAIDALADEHTTWGLLQHLFAETIRPDLELKEGPNGVTVSRRGRGLGSVSPKDAKSFEGIANAVGWQLFLQELWGLPEWTGEDFYGGRTGSADGPRTPDVTVSGGVLPVELAVPLPRVLTEQREVVIEVSLAGVPLFSMRTPTVNGVLEPARLRQAVILAGGIELANVAIREAVMSEAWPADMTLRERLAALASRRAASSAERGDRALALLAELVPFGGTVVAIGRRPGLRARGPASHTHTFPYESRDDFLRVAHATGTPVLETGNTIESDAEPDGIGVYLPWLFDNIRSALYVDPEADELAEQFDLMFSATEDPWDYSTPYELQKYEDTASLLPERVRFAYEIGCAEGVFTARLASHADHLDAVDISHVALDRAATRCADVPNVSFERLNIFRDRLPKKADLIVCSELLYYANDVSKLRETVRRLIDALAPSGVLVTTNSNCVVDDPQSPGFDWDAPFGAAGIQDALLADGRVTLTRERVAPMYRVQRYELSSRVQRLLHRGRSGTPASERVSEISDLPPEVRHHFLPHGGFVDTSGRTGATTRYLPVLMYHRVSPHSVAANHRYTVSPGLFDEHMAWLHEHGFIPITIDEWVASVIARRPVQGRRVMLTFDDGYEDFAEYALPALTKYGLTAEVFVVSGLAGGQNTWESADIPRYRLMDWDTLASLPHRTVRIGAHTVNHRPLSLLSITEIADELLRCRETLEDRLGRSVTSIAYPYGIADPAVHHLAGAAGYRYGYAASGWFVPDHDHILDLTLSLPRAEITGSTTLDLFSRKLDPNGGDLDS